MAQNRLFLTCMRCMEDFAIARIGAGSYEWESARNNKADFDAFLKAHQECDPDRINGVLCVKLTTEDDYLIESRAE